jgi:hypothetical protein
MQAPLELTAFHPNFTKLNDFVVDDKPNDIKGSSTYFNFQARVHTMIEIFFLSKKTFFLPCLLLQSSKNFHFIRKFLHGDLVRYTSKVRGSSATVTKHYTLDISWVWALGVGDLWAGILAEANISRFVRKTAGSDLNLGTSYTDSELAGFSSVLQGIYFKSR